MSCTRRGATLVETCIAVTIAAVALAITLPMWIFCCTGTAASIRTADGVRSVLTAADRLSPDLRRLVYQGPQDLGVIDGGRGLSFLVARSSASDPWTLDTSAVTYRLEPLSPGSPACRLVRSVDGAREPVRDCVLADMRVRVQDDRVEVTLVAWPDVPERIEATVSGWVRPVEAPSHHAAGEEVSS
jgi:hypothetical protein